MGSEITRRLRNIILAMWIAVKKSGHSKSSTSGVYHPKPSKCASTCCMPLLVLRSCKSTFKDVINGNTRFRGNHMNFSPGRSISSSDLIHSAINHVEPINSSFRMARDHNAAGLPNVGCPSSPGLGRSPLGRDVSVTQSGDGGGFCKKCGESLARQNAEEHHLSKHSVVELLQGDSTRKIIEQIFNTGWMNSLNGRIQGCVPIETILRVHNTESKLAHFEGYREMVKVKSIKLQYSTKHPRCLADGNELLRFYGTTVACRLGHNRSTSLCTLQACNVCSILRHGFSSYRELDQSVLGVYTTSTSEISHRSIENSNRAFRKALILCRVIAGRVQQPVGRNSPELEGNESFGFDSFAGNLGSDRSQIEELYVSNPSALLPCFVIVC